MHIREFAKPVTAKTLNESLAKRFGTKIKLESFTLQQLHDARNKLRTQLSQIEMTENFNSAVENDTYQKSKMFLDVLNAEISERGDIDDPAIEEAAKPDYIDLDKDGDKKEPMKKAAKDAKKKKNESIVREGAEDQAEIVMAAKDMVDRVTNWMEDTAEMQTESMLELADAIRDEMGSEKSEQFVQSVKPSLESMYAAMEATRSALSGGVGLLTGEGGPTDMMGGDMEAMPPEDEMAMEPTVDMEAGMGDADLAAAGGEEPLGREQRESVDPRKLGKMLAGSKKK
jgi:cell division septum initiation protein DivIVA